ncbi:Putative NmrA-like domain, NAD(P)-binding domain superfamily [Colletotrichum destructivum]|uniref:NmrA-like domain, NAD(P)-binding domain superfamily n=1 Tax=Colletotrichum destructivum TaxID=34406 RepID=A0AAX4IH04_9PEZI|nr:Putative NmrA-like domain, NAD(P)-binding domain superfamily [Colletotrichum destructivum]
MSSHKVGIFPASGGIGGGTVKHVLPRLPPTDLVLIARSPERLAPAKALGAEVRQTSYDDDFALKHAFDGIDTLFLISYASVEHQYRTKRHTVAINAAIQSGVKYIFYGSLGFAGPPENKQSVAHVMQAHLDTENYLEECRQNHPGFGYTVIREGLYSESYPLYTSFYNPKQPRSKIRIPHDGSGPGVAWVKREELGEGTAELISRFVKQPKEFAWRNQTVLLSGEKTLTLAETVQILGEIADSPVQITQVSDDEFATQSENPPNFTYHGFDLSKPWATAFEAFRRGEASYVSPLLRELLGREPEDFKTTVENSL